MHSAALFFLVLAVAAVISMAVSALLDPPDVR